MSGSLDSIRRAIVTEARAGAGYADLFRACVDQITEATKVDGWCGLTLDPATLLMTGGVHEHGLPMERISRLLAIEHGESDFNLFADLARASPPVALLSTATEGELEKSSRYRDVLRPSDYEHELRAVLRSGGRSWGALVLLRRPSSPDFAAGDLALVEGLAEVLAEGIRACLLATAASTASMERSDRAVIVLGSKNEVISMTSAADRWIAELAEHGPSCPSGLPMTVQTLADETRKLALGGDRVGSARARTRARGGHWVTLHGALLGEDSVAVLIEPSRPQEIASLILDAYGLTAREGELVRHLLLGFDTRQIAEQLGISAYTVQDHLKAIFDKVGVSSRKELVARLFFTHYLPRMQAGASVGYDGWFD